MNKECLQIIRSNSQHIKREFEVTGMTLFGSVARGDNRPDSDIDILVDMPPKIFLMASLKSHLEKLLNASVDLIRRHSHLSPKFLTQISKDGITIF